jgi:ribosomal-protein-alanine N-acetyltransferase
VEINVRPENTASLRVIQKLGFRYEGLKQRYIHINGDWRDHYVFALTKEELPAGLLNIFVRGEVKPQKYPWN